MSKAAPKQTRQPSQKALVIMAVIFGLLLVLSLLVGGDLLFTTPDFEAMTEAERMIAITKVALLTNAWFFWIGVVIALWLMKMLRPVALWGIIPAGLLQAKFTMVAIPLMELLEEAAKQAP